MFYEPKWYFVILDKVGIFLNGIPRLNHFLFSCFSIREVKTRGRCSTILVLKIALVMFDAAAACSLFRLFPHRWTGLSQIRILLTSRANRYGLLLATVSYRLDSSHTPPHAAYTKRKLPCIDVSIGSPRILPTGRAALSEMMSLKGQILSCASESN